jgi:alpha-ribazole phosphatase
MSKLYLLRHGQVSGEAALYGHTDVAVADEVNQHIQKGLNTLAINFDHVFSSPLQRCLSLAKSLAMQNQGSLAVVDGFKEINFGYYDGVAFDQLHLDRSSWQQLEKFWQNPMKNSLPEAELLAEFSERVVSAWQNLLAELTLQPSNKNILIVCHGGVIRMILAHILAADIANANWYSQLSIDYGSLTTLTLAQDNVLKVNCIAQPISSSKHIGLS